MPSAFLRHLLKKITPETAFRQGKDFKTWPQGIEGRSRVAKPCDSESIEGEKNRKRGLIDVHSWFWCGDPRNDCRIFQGTFNVFESILPPCGKVSMARDGPRIHFPFCIVRLYVVASGEAPSGG